MYSLYVYRYTSTERGFFYILSKLWHANCAFNVPILRNIGILYFVFLYGWCLLRASYNKITKAQASSYILVQCFIYEISSFFMLIYTYINGLPNLYKRITLVYAYDASTQLYTYYFLIHALHAALGVRHRRYY